MQIGYTTQLGTPVLRPHETAGEGAYCKENKMLNSFIINQNHNTMKRFYKFLMPLVAIVAMALPATVQAQGDSCTIKIVGEDGYGDGWNDGSLAIV